MCVYVCVRVCTCVCVCVVRACVRACVRVYLTMHQSIITDLLCYTLLTSSGSCFFVLCINIDNFRDYHIWYNPCMGFVITMGVTMGVYTVQAWNANHFAAWSSRLHQHSMFRHRQLSEGMILPPHMQHGQDQIDINHVTPINSWITGSRESMEEMRKGTHVCILNLLAIQIKVKNS